jgi:hypothetical protein
MNSARKTQFLACLKDGPGFVNTEHTVLDEHITEVGQVGYSGEHLLDHQLDIAIPIRLVLRWDRVGTEEGGAHGDRKLVSDPAGDPKQKKLSFEVESVPRLDLDGGGAASDHGPDSFGGQFKQRLF